MKQPRYLPFIALVVLMVIWGYSWVPGKLGVVNSNPFMFAAFRTLPGALVLLALLPLTGRSLRPKAMLMTVTVGVLQVSGFVGFISAALATGGAGHGALLANTWQFWLLLLAWLFLGEHLVRSQWLSVGVALVGLVLIIEPWGVRGVTSSLLTLAGALIFSAGAVLFKVLRKRYEIDLLSLTAWQSFFGCLPLVVLAFAVPGDPIQWNFDFIYSVVFSAFIGTALGGLLWLYVLNALPANLAGIGTIGTPVVGVLSSWLLLGEKLSGWEIAGMVLVVSALALLVLYGSGLLNRLLKKDVSPLGRDEHAQDKDAKSVSSSAICVTEDAVLGRSVRAGGLNFVFQQPAKRGAPVPSPPPTGAPRAD